MNISENMCIYKFGGGYLLFSIVLLLTKIQKGFIKFLEPADCGIFRPNSIAVVRYGALIRAKSPTNCDVHLAESFFEHALAHRCI